MSAIFVSYSRKDDEAVRRFAGALRKDGHSVALDQDIIPGGQLWREKIVEAIGRADVVLVLLSSSSIKSDEVRKELDIAVDRKKAIVPALLEPVQVPDKIAYQLAGLQLVDLATIQGAAEERLSKAIRAAVGTAASAGPVDLRALLATGGLLERAPRLKPEPPPPSPPEPKKRTLEGLAALLPGHWHVDVDTTVTALYRTEDNYIFSLDASGEFEAERVSSRAQTGHTTSYSEKYEGSWEVVGQSGVRFDYYPSGVGGKQSFSFKFDMTRQRELRGTTDIHPLGRRHALWRRFS
jgi:hypothetical protein